MHFASLTIHFVFTIQGHTLKCNAFHIPNEGIPPKMQCTPHTQDKDTLQDAKYFACPTQGYPLKCNAFHIPRTRIPLKCIALYMPHTRTCNTWSVMHFACQTQGYPPNCNASHMADARLHPKMQCFLYAQHNDTLENAMYFKCPTQGYTIRSNTFKMPNTNAQHKDTP